jgi:hypothetical protein
MVSGLPNASVFLNVLYEAPLLEGETMQGEPATSLPW